MLEVTVDAQAVIDQINNMQEQLTAFPTQMATELTTWQTDDMHRQKPNTTQEEKSVYTLITQHTPGAKKLVTASPVRRQRLRSRELHPKVLHQPRGLKLVRPILRPHLFDMLCARMRKLLKEKLKWQ